MNEIEILNVKLFTRALQEKVADKFSCGNPHIDSFIKSPLSLDNSYGKTYAFLSSDEETLIGFYNLGVGYIEKTGDVITRKMGGAIHINEFALDLEYRNTLMGYDEEGKKVNLSDMLLNECLERIETIRQNSLGFSFVTLCSTDEGFSLYKRRDFEELEETMNFSVEYAEAKCTPMYYWLDQDDYI